MYVPTRDCVAQYLLLPPWQTKTDFLVDTIRQHGTAFQIPPLPGQDRMPISFTASQYGEIKEGLYPIEGVKATKKMTREKNQEKICKQFLSEAGLRSINRNNTTDKLFVFDVSKWNSAGYRLTTGRNYSKPNMIYDPPLPPAKEVEMEEEQKKAPAPSNLKSTTAKRPFAALHPLTEAIDASTSRSSAASTLKSPVAKRPRSNVKSATTPPSTPAANTSASDTIHVPNTPPTVVQAELQDENEETGIFQASIREQYDFVASLFN